MSFCFAHSSFSYFRALFSSEILVASLRALDEHEMRGEDEIRQWSDGSLLFSAHGNRDSYQITIKNSRIAIRQSEQLSSFCLTMPDLQRLSMSGIDKTMLLLAVWHSLACLAMVALPCH